MTQTRILIQRVLPSTFSANSAKPLSVPLYTQRRHQQTQPKLEKKEIKSGARESKSFCFNVFNGDFVGDQVFPYPDVLSKEQKDELGQMVDHFTVWGQQGRIFRSHGPWLANGLLLMVL